MTAFLGFLARPLVKWGLVAVAVFGLLWAVDHYRASAELAATKLEHATKRAEELEASNKLLTDNQQAWADALRKIDELAQDTAEARAEESARLSNLAASLAATKEGIKHAPGADDSFVFSDALYRWMRQPDSAEPESGSAQDAPAATPNVD